MIQLTPTPGGPPVRHVVPTYSPGRQRRFDAWYTHAASEPYLFATEHPDGVFNVFLQVQLVDGVTYLYQGPAFNDAGGASDWINRCVLWQVSGYPGNWFGEGFNAFVRSALGARWTVEQFSNWLSS